MKTRSLGPTWPELSQLGILLLSTFGGAVLPPPSVFEPSARPWPAQLVVVLLGLLFILAGRRWQRRRGVWLGWGVASGALGVAGLVVYLYLLDAWTCAYYGATRMMGNELTPYAAQYLQDNPELSCEELLKTFTGRREEIWTRTSLLRNELLASALHLCVVTLLTLATLVVAGGLTRSLGPRGALRAGGGRAGALGPGPAPAGRVALLNRLAITLSQIELAHESIRTHASTTLQHPELVEIPSPAHARALWWAVLQQADREGAVPQLVGAVLGDYPAAEDLKEALRAWMEAPAPTPALPVVPPRPGMTLPFGLSAAPWRWALTVAGVIGLTWRLVTG
jgi:hypothetical protein